MVFNHSYITGHSTTAAWSSTTGTSAPPDPRREFLGSSTPMATSWVITLLSIDHPHPLEGGQHTSQGPDLLSHPRLKRMKSHPEACWKVEMELSVTFFLLLNTILACGNILFCTPCGFGLADSDSSQLRQTPHCQSSTSSHSPRAQKESLSLLN